MKKVPKVEFVRMVVEDALLKNVVVEKVLKHGKHFYIFTTSDRYNTEIPCSLLDDGMSITAAINSISYELFNLRTRTSTRTVADNYLIGDAE